jgi:hypothetical protein
MRWLKSLEPEASRCSTARKKPRWWHWFAGHRPKGERAGPSDWSPNTQRDAVSPRRSVAKRYEWFWLSTSSSRGGKKMWCVPAVNEEFIERMENVLELYARPYDWKEPVVVLDERPVQLLDPERPGIAMRSGSPMRTDYEYVRRGTANIFCVVEPLSGVRLTRATRNRKAAAYAHMVARIEKQYSSARTIHLVQDNLSTHTERSLVATFGPKVGRKLWSRFTVHYTPKHASWLNAAEIEASLVARECLGTRRIGELRTLRREVAAWRRRASHHSRSITWKFRVNDARRVFRYEGIKTPRSKH